MEAPSISLQDCVGMTKPEGPLNDASEMTQRERYPCNFDSNQYPNFYFTTRGNKIDLISDEGDVLFAVEQLIKDARIVLAIRERRRPLNIDEEWEKNECD
ncbi:hypothetical protein HPP92_022682 [Vanilla planifolia]|uniref:Uncharacterized protein n=1 Tax=Vanilla planifolia TaxID=51239 RepID=A0A835UDV3_VANPL|nr:hypothetical protein HPP92_022682 [Vanilla planifolia]